jgi:small subunit ribosomal protein S23
MGRYNFAAQNVHKYATRLLQAKQIKAPPSWYEIVGSLPPAKRLVRPAMQRPQNAGRKSSKLFKPLSLTYEEDRLRWEYFNDHPWELARPRVVLEDDGRDHERHDWGLPLDYNLNRPAPNDKDALVQQQYVWDATMKSQAARPINGEA